MKIQDLIAPGWTINGAHQQLQNVAAARTKTSHHSNAEPPNNSNIHADPHASTTTVCMFCTSPAYCGQ